MAVTAEAHLELNPFWGRPLPGNGPPEGVRQRHRSLAGYAPTPLLSGDQIAADLGIGALFIKDESQRFGLNSFKALGPGYAVGELLEGRVAGDTILAAASEGNHGRALAWAARRAGCRAVVFMGRGVARWRREAIRRLGAEVRIVDGDYDDAVRQAAVESAAGGWVLASDTAVGAAAGAAEAIVHGYTTLFREAVEQAGESFHLVLLQAGVGGLAAAGVQALAGAASGPLLVTVEPLGADCLRRSILSSQGGICSLEGRPPTAMSCLNCGRPSETAWPWIRAGINGFAAIADDWADEAVKRLAGVGIGSQPSGAAGLGGLLALCRHPDLRASWNLFQLGRNSRVLVINTEGRPIGTEDSSVREAHEVV